MSWLRPFPSDRDGWVVAVLRLLGAVSLFLAVIALMGIIALVDALTGPQHGWEGLIAGAAVLVGGGALLLALGVGIVAHRGSVQYREDANKPLWLIPVGFVMVLLGVAACLPWLLSDYPAPLDRYVAGLGSLLGVAGAVMAWRLSRSRSPPA